MKSKASQHTDTEVDNCGDRSDWTDKDYLYEEEFYRFQEEYSDLREFLESYNGVLYTATRNGTGDDVIIKKIWKHNVAELHMHNGRECPNEVYYHLRALRASPNLVIPLIDWFEFEDFYLISMAKIHGARDLFHLVKNRKRPLSEARARNIFSQISRVAYDLHKAGICHRDLKDENFIVGPNDAVYLIDFGTTMDLDSSYSDYVGTPCFFPPEYFNRGFARPEELTVWSLGSILYIMLARNWRWTSDDTWSRDARDESHISSTSVKFIDQVLNPDPDQRLKLIEIINSDWLQA